MCGIGLNCLTISDLAGTRGAMGGRRPYPPSQRCNWTAAQVGASLPQPHKPAIRFHDPVSPPQPSPQFPARTHTPVFHILVNDFDTHYCSASPSSFLFFQLQQYTPGAHFSSLLLNRHAPLARSRPSLPRPFSKSTAIGGLPCTPDVARCCCTSSRDLQRPRIQCNAPGHRIYSQCRLHTR